MDGSNLDGKTVAEHIVDFLERREVRHVFGLCGHLAHNVYALRLKALQMGQVFHVSCVVLIGVAALALGVRRTSDKVRVAEFWFRIKKRIAILKQNHSSSSQKYSMSCCSIPFHGWPKPWIDISFTSSQQTELE